MNAGPLLNARTGRAVIVAMDHGIGSGAVRGLESPAGVLEEVLGGTPDAVLLGPHLARLVRPRLHDAAMPFWVTLDAYSASTVPGRDDAQELHVVIAAPALARDLGASGVKALLVFGQRDAAAYVDNVRAVAMLSEQAHQVGLPLMVETVLWGARISDSERDSPEILQHACRIAFELGADLIKAAPPRTGFREIVASTPVPILMLGGDRGGNHRGFFHDVAAAVAAGVRGVVCGRMVWQHPAPAEIVRALCAVVHDERPVADVLGR